MGCTRPGRKRSRDRTLRSAECPDPGDAPCGPRAPGRLRSAPVLLALALGPCLTAWAPARVDAQAGDSPPRVVVVALAGPSWPGTRFSWTTPSGSARFRVSPANALALGGQLEVRVSEHLALAGMATWSSHSYHGEGDAPGDELRSSGKQRITRLTGGLHYRFRSTARGYLAGGAALNLVTPGTDVFFDDEAERREWGGYGGIGLDFGTGRTRVRVEGRGQLSRIRSDDVTGFGEVFQAQDWAFDLMLWVGVAFGF